MAGKIIEYCKLRAKFEVQRVLYDKSVIKNPIEYNKTLKELKIYLMEIDNLRCEYHNVRFK